MNSKTPIMILQEHMMKSGKAPPSYSQLENLNSTLFQYSVQVDSLHAIGSGRNKKDAKQNAAMNALQKLQDLGKYFPSPNESIKRDPSKEVENPQVNVTQLNDLCSEYQLPTPEYQLLSDTGPPHNKLFTMKCTTGSIERKATASTKKLAKQIAAGHVLEYYKKNVPERINDIVDNADSLVCLNEAARQKYADLCKEMPWRPNLGQIVANYHLAFSNSLDKSHKEEILNMLKCRDQSISSILFIEELFNKISLDYEWSEISAKKGHIVTFCVRRANPPIFILAHGTNAFDAKKNCAEEVIEYVNVMIY